jgi:hypothetical protein
MRLEGLGQLKSNPVTSSAVEPATFQACSVAAKPITLPRAPVLKVQYEINFSLTYCK